MNTTLEPASQPHIFRFVHTPDGDNGQIVDEVTRTFWNGSREVSYQDYCVQFDSTAVWATEKKMAARGWTFTRDPNHPAER